MIEYNYLIRQWNGGITIEKLHLRISVFNNFFRKKSVSTSSRKHPQSRFIYVFIIRLTAILSLKETPNR
jgi:hypothetical protein